MAASQLTWLADLGKMQPLMGYDNKPEDTCHRTKPLILSGGGFIIYGCCMRLLPLSLEAWKNIVGE